MRIRSLGLKTQAWPGTEVDHNQIKSELLFIATQLNVLFPHLPQPTSKYKAETGD
jgi:hypothetical protein